MAYTTDIATSNIVLRGCSEIEKINNTINSWKIHIYGIIFVLDG